MTRGIIDIRDTVECIRLACENPADAGEFRVFNPTDQVLRHRLEAVEHQVDPQPGLRPRIV